MTKDFIEETIESMLAEWREHPACKKINEYGSVYHTRGYATEYEGECLPDFMARKMREALLLQREKVLEKLTKDIGVIGAMYSFPNREKLEDTEAFKGIMECLKESKII